MLGTEQSQIQEALLTKQEWQELLQQNGLMTQKVYADLWPLKWIPMPRRNTFKYLLGLCKKFRIWSLPIEKSYQFIFVCQIEIP